MLDLREERGHQGLVKIGETSPQRFGLYTGCCHSQLGMIEPVMGRQTTAECYGWAHLKFQWESPIGESWVTFKGVQTNPLVEYVLCLVSSMPTATSLALFGHLHLTFI